MQNDTGFAIGTETPAEMRQTREYIQENTSPTPLPGKRFRSMPLGRGKFEKGDTKKMGKCDRKKERGNTGITGTKKLKG